MALKKRKKVSAVGGSALGGKKAARKAAKKPTKKAARKTAKKRPVKKTTARRKIASKKKPTVKKSAKKEGNLIGLITHYFPHVQAAVIKLKKPLAAGETVKIKGHTTDLTQIVTSMQIDRVDITSAKKGDEIGLKVSSRVRQHDKVYKV